VTTAGGWGAVLASVLGLVFTLFKTAPAGGSDARAMGAPARATRIVFAVMPALVLVVLAAGLAWVAHAAIVHVMSDPDNRLGPLSAASYVAIIVALALASYEARSVHRRLVVSLLVLVLLLRVIPDVVVLVSTRDASLTRTLAGLLAIAVAWVMTLGWMVDPNVLSLHAFYKARLVRAYLGASNQRRAGSSSEITDAVEGDDVLLRDLRNCDHGAPYHLVNTTLNLVAGRDLATAQRSAAPFILTRRYCGSARTGYRPTDRYMGGGLSLGAAVATSGAAASPNMGTRTPTASLAALMTLLNVRLGYWAPPRRTAAPGPPRRRGCGPSTRCWS
jgi:hypothetical protein